jgi:replicative DNA helicase
MSLQSPTEGGGVAKTRNPRNERPRHLESSTTDGHRVPPHDLEAEKAILSALLLDNDAIHSVYTEVIPEDFYHPAHRQLYLSMLSLQDSNQPVDLHTLADYLNSQKTLDAIGGPVFLAEIADYEATAANVVHHARIVRDKSVKRSLIAVATEIAEAGYDQADAADHLLDSAESKIFEIGQQKARTAFRSLHDEMNEALDYVEMLIQRGGELTGVPTQFRDFDEMTGGLQPGELVVIASRPSMGKTALALNIARNAAIEHGKKAAIFSLEMTKRALALRLLASEANIDFSGFRKGFGRPEDLRKLTQAGGKLADANIWIDDSGVITILEIKAKCRRLASERGLDMVIVEALAKELDIPVIALSQLNRGPEQRDPDKRRPNMGDLRESGAIEQDADVIAFIYRDEVYNPTEENHGVAELIIAKQRNGPTGTVKLQFTARYAGQTSRTLQCIRTRRQLRRVRRRHILGASLAQTPGPATGRGIGDSRSRRPREWRETTSRRVDAARCGFRGLPERRPTRLRRLPGRRRCAPGFRTHGTGQ